MPMRVYFDSSAVISILQKEKDYQRTLEAWEECERPCSSILLRIEAMTSIRRNFSAGGNEKALALETRASELRRMLDMTVLIPVEEQVAEIVEREEKLTRCRSLDAIHLATALYIQQETWEPVAVCSLDLRMREAARALKLEVLPE